MSSMCWSPLYEILASLICLHIHVVCEQILITEQRYILSTYVPTGWSMTICISLNWLKHGNMHIFIQTKLSTFAIYVPTGWSMTICISLYWLKHGDMHIFIQAKLSTLAGLTGTTKVRALVKRFCCSPASFALSWLVYSKSHWRSLSGVKPLLHVEWI